MKLRNQKPKKQEIKKQEPETKKPEKPTTQTVEIKVKDNTKDCVAIIVRERNGTPIQVGEQKFKPSDTSFSFKGRTFPLQTLKPLYANKRKNYFLFDLEGYIITTTKNKIAVSVDELDLLVTKNIVAGLFAKLGKALEKQEMSGKILGYVITAIAAGAIGYILGSQLGAPHTAQQIITNSTQPVASVIMGLFS